MYASVGDDSSAPTQTLLGEINQRLTVAVDRLGMIERQLREIEERVWAPEPLNQLAKSEPEMHGVAACTRKLLDDVEGGLTRVEALVHIVSRIG
jgi:hypothetical protein